MHPAPRFSLTRRRLIGTAFAAGTLTAIGSTRGTLAQTSGPFALPPLPYPEEALAPVISGPTMGFHYGKHHRAYVDNLNKAIDGTDLVGRSLEKIVKTTAADPARASVFNNAAQGWNHTFYWNSMLPTGTACGPTAAERRPAGSARKSNHKTLIYPFCAIMLDMSTEPEQPDDLATLYRDAFAEYGTRAPWNQRELEEPTPADALVVARACAWRATATPGGWSRSPPNVE
jgi:Iron/manganese superoxide dismutases, alpha-hairpin domain